LEWLSVRVIVLVFLSVPTAKGRNWMSQESKPPRVLRWGAIDSNALGPLLGEWSGS